MLNILIQLAEADKDFATVEREMIYEIARERNFPKESVDQLMKNPEPIGTLGALSQGQKLDYLLAVVRLIFADQQVLDSEVTFSKSIAIKLGFKKNVVDYLVDNFKKTTQEDLKKKVFSEFTLT